MEILKFKTNVSDREGLAQVAPFIDKLDTIKDWKIDTETEDNILSISGENVDPQRVKNAVQAAGFEIEFLRIVGISGEET